MDKGIRISSCYEFKYFLSEVTTFTDIFTCISYVMVCSPNKKSLPEPEYLHVLSLPKPDPESCKQPVQKNAMQFEKKTVSV